MEDYSEEEAEEYNTSEVDWGEEADQDCWDDGDDHTEGHWCADSVPEYVPNDEQEYPEVEPESMDQYSTCYGPKSQLIYEDSSEGKYYSQACPRREKTTVAAPSRSYHGSLSRHAHSTPWNYNGDQFYQNRLAAPSIHFSGHKQGPSAYLRWEDDMEQWFIAWRIPEKLKLTYAKDTLTGEAYNWWSQLDADRIYFNDPAFTWKEVKMLMYSEFVKKAKYIQKVSTRRLIKHQVLQPTVQREVVSQRQSSRPVHPPQVKRNQGEHSNSLKPSEVICYRCQGKGHLAKECPTKRVVKSVVSEAKETNLEVSDSDTRIDDSFSRMDKHIDDLINLIKARSTVLTHLSSAQKVESISGTNIEIKEQEPNLAAQSSPTLDKVISELKVNNLTYQNTGMMHLHSVQNVDEGLGNEETRTEAKQQENNEQSTLETSTPADHALEVVNTKAESMQDNQVSEALNLTQYYFFESSTSSMKHLLLPISDDSDIGTMEKHPEPNSQPYTQAVVSGEAKCKIGDFKRETTSLPRESIDLPWKGVMASLLIKEEPPYGQCITKPSIYQGKTLASQNRMKPNFLYLGAGKLVLRTKPFEEGGNDEDLKSVAGPPTHEINHTSYIGASSDIGALKEGYLCNHKEFNRETSFYRFSTQPEHAANWFHTKKSNGLGDMPVTSQTIYTASELVLIKESNSLLKECATQTHVWKPGDYSLHLRAVGEFLPCTSSHMIKMNPLFVNLPYMDAFTLGVIKDQRLFPLLFRHDLETIQTSKEIPRMHLFLPKLTRYKERRQLPYMDRFCTN
uniref:CCHC-type domain-containing protein n=3 Tax=Brassica campestris TaxID=3711 RepID=M4D152_BRACM